MKMGVWSIDLDSQALKRDKILNAVKGRVGEKRAINICTFGKEGTKSAIITACRGLNLDNSIGAFLSSLVPVERGQAWEVEEMFYGNEEKERKPIKEFIREVEQYPALRDTIFKFAGLINKRSVHASGIFIFDDETDDRNIYMRSKNGQLISQFDMRVSEENLGLTKIDFLTIEALDYIRVCLDLLIEHDVIEWQGTLRETYNKYLHPDVLEYDDPKMWELLKEGKVQNLFQFTTDLGRSIVKKSQPNNMDEMSSINSLMRLSADWEEQPIDRFLRFRDNIEEWYEECRENGLNQEEIEVLEKYLLPVYGQANTQEDLITMLMEEKISNFSMPLADKSRKSISKKIKEDVENIINLFYEEGEKAGTRKELLDYVWKYQVEPQLGYAFSRNHVKPYTGIAIQEMNLNYSYPPIMWDTACLIVDSGSMEEKEEDEENDEEQEDKEKGKTKQTDYGKMAKAIANMRINGREVSLPDINNAKFGFSPILEKDEILFGLRGMSGIGDEVAEEIIKKRPYDSLQDFVDKCLNIEQSIVKNSHIIMLIKGGAFDSLENKPRIEIMKDYLWSQSNPKESLNMQNIASIERMGLVPKKFDKEYTLYAHRKSVLAQKPHEVIPNLNPNVKKKIDDKLYRLVGDKKEFYINNYDNKEIVENGGDFIIISQKALDKEYNKLIEPLKNGLSEDKQLLEQYNLEQVRELWREKAMGNPSSWEMEALCFYHGEHELKNINEIGYGVSKLSDLPIEPNVVGEFKWGGKKFNKYEINRIACTVLDKNATKHSLTVLTHDGEVVTVKFHRGAFAHYNKQIKRENEKGKNYIAEGSWFKRGSKLLIAGYREEDIFKPKTYKDSIYQHTVAYIDKIDSEGNLKLRIDRLEQ